MLEYHVLSIKHIHTQSAAELLFPTCPQQCCDKNLYWLQNRDTQSVSTLLCKQSIGRRTDAQYCRRLVRLLILRKQYCIKQKCENSEGFSPPKHRGAYCCVGQEKSIGKKKTDGETVLTFNNFRILLKQAKSLFENVHLDNSF